MTTADRVNYLVDTYQINQVFATRLASQNNDFSPENIQQVLKEKPKPFVKWVGGKRQLLAQFREKGLYPPSGFNAEKHTYFEPFLGGGAVFFDLLPLQASINDINSELTTTGRYPKSKTPFLSPSIIHQLGVSLQTPQVASSMQSVSSADYSTQ